MLSFVTEKKFRYFYDLLCIGLYPHTLLLPIHCCYPVFFPTKSFVLVTYVDMWTRLNLSERNPPPTWITTPKTKLALTAPLLLLVFFCSFFPQSIAISIVRNRTKMFQCLPSRDSALIYSSRNIDGNDLQHSNYTYFIINVAIAFFFTCSSRHSCQHHHSYHHRVC